MHTDQLRYFLALWQERSFTRAARRCGISQPSLTNAILRLERTLGGTLFRRQRGNIELTRLGRIVAPYLREAHYFVERAQREAAGLLIAQAPALSKAEPVEPVASADAPIE